MKNILSYAASRFTGKEINEWCQDQIDNHRGIAREREARRLLKKHYKNTVLYETIYCDANSGSGSPQKIVFKKVRENA